MCQLQIYTLYNNTHIILIFECIQCIVAPSAGLLIPKTLVQLTLNTKTNLEYYFISVLDSWGKIPSGILNGDLYELGDFDECLDIEAPNNFEPQYW